MHTDFSNAPTAATCNCFAWIAIHQAGCKRGIALARLQLYRDGVPDPQDIGKFEWQTSLSYMSASDEAIKDVQTRMGQVLR